MYSSIFLHKVMQSKALVILVGTGIMLIIGVQQLLAFSKDYFIQQAFVTHMETTN
ncbi:MAG: hypothetical protein WBQ25_16680 [Nitrososphaeraceae archaeon]